MVESIARRRALAWASLAAIALPVSTRAADMNIEDFLALDESAFAPWQPAREPAQWAAQIRAIVAQISRVDGIALPQMYPMGPSAPGVQIGPIGRGRSCALIAYSAEPHAVLPAHNHPNYSVATLGLSGEVLITHFEPPEFAPPMTSSASFNVRKTSERVLRSGDVSMLTPSADNIHRFVAGASGASWVDITVPNGPDVGFSFLTLDDASLAQTGATVAAHWRPPG